MMTLRDQKGSGCCIILCGCSVYTYHRPAVKELGKTQDPELTLVNNLAVAHDTSELALLHDAIRDPAATNLRRFLALEADVEQLEHGSLARHALLDDRREELDDLLRDGVHKLVNNRRGHDGDVLRCSLILHHARDLDRERDDNT